MRRVDGGRCGWRMRLAAALTALAAVLVFGAALAGAPVAGAPVALADNGPTSLSIMLPAPNGNLSEGPVGTYVSISGSGTASEPYNLGYATQSTGCQSGFQALQNNGSAVTFTAGQDGSFSYTFAWPSAANDVGTQYYICAQDANNASAPVIQGTDFFRVDSSTKPAIAVQPADISTPTPGALPTPTPRPDHLYAGSGAQITGSNFFPFNTTVLLYLSFRDISNLSAGTLHQTLQNSQQLTPMAGGQITSGPDGAFSATVALPNQTGVFYIVAVSTDGTGNLLPSLQAVTKVELQVAPQATPSPTPSPSPSPTATSKGGGSGTTNTSGTNPNQPAIFALGGTSIILFVVGVMLLASTVAGPRPRSPQQY